MSPPVTGQQLRDSLHFESAGSSRTRCAAEADPDQWASVITFALDGDVAGAIMAAALDADVRLGGVQFSDAQCGFRAIRRDAARELAAAPGRGHRLVPRRRAARPR
jgi:hypothetical protein